MNENVNEHKNRHIDDIYREEADRDEGKESEKLRIVEDLLKSLRKKRESIVLQTVHLNSFNKRLELLLECFNAYSFENDKENRAEMVGDRKSATAGGGKKTLEEMCEDQRQSVVSEEENNNGESIERRMDRIFGMKKMNSKVNKKLAVEIYNLIKSNKNIPFDDLVKRIKQSKYKVVEIINTLIKEKIVIKTFDKGFVYKINKNIL